METIGQRLKRLREASGLSQGALATAAGLKSQGTIGNIERETRGYGDSVVDIARVLGVTPDYLRCSEGAAQTESNVEPAPQIRPRKGVPVVGEVKGGDDGYLDELQYPVGHGDGTVDYPTADPYAYALRVRGDSMHPRYRAGEFIVVEPSIEAMPGDDVVVALHDGRKLLKELNWERDGEVQLLSVNNHFGPLTLPRTDIQFIQLVAGRVRRSAIHKA